MVTLHINERSKAGKALLATAQLLAAQNKGIEFAAAMPNNPENEDSVLEAKMKQNNTGDLLSPSEQKKFLNKLKNEANS
jgi:hypothetical protein